MSKLTCLHFSALIGLLVASSINAQPREPKKTEVNGHTMYTLLKPGDIPAIFEPVYISIDSAGNYYHDNEPLMVIADGDSAKAFSTWHLDRHEVVNTYINGKAITVTW